MRHSLGALADHALRPLVSWLNEEATTGLTLIPCGWLASFPLPSAHLVNGRTLGQILPTSVAPSARSFHVHEDTSTDRSGVYAVGDPYPTHQPLLWGEAEAQTLVQIAHHMKLPGKVKVHKKATRSWLIEVLHRGLVVDISFTLGVS